MPRNGSGLYVPPPANYPAVSATTITAANRNAIDADIATALTNSIAVNGESVVTADIAFGNNKLTGVKDGTLAKDAANVSQIQNSNAILLASVAGTDTITASLSPALTAYANGQIFTLIPANTNTGAVTININGLGAKSITKNGSTALEANDLVAGVTYSLQYDGTRFQKIAGSDYVSINGGQISGFRNAIINGNFTINQRVVSGTVTLSAGAYGHDRWKAGAGGCTYTFATSANVTTLTITAGTLMQVIEGNNLQSGSYKLSWTGTATARIDGGSYGASGVTGTAVGGTNQTIEFSTGTVSKVMYEFGIVATLFEHRPIGVELALCQRYYYKTYNQSIAPGSVSNAGQLFTAAQATSNYLSVERGLPQTMRIAPAVTAYSPAAGTAGNCTVDGVDKAVLVAAGESSVYVYINNLATTANQFMAVHFVANAEIT